MRTKTLKYGYTELEDHSHLSLSMRCRLQLMEFKGSSLTTMIVNPKAFKNPRACFEVLRRMVAELDLDMKVHYRSVYEDVEVLKLP